MENENDFDKNEISDLEQQQFIEYQALITHQIEVLNDVYKTIDSETLQKKIREKLINLIDCL